MNIFEKHESAVRGYCRSFPVVFDRAEGEIMTTEDGTQYLDFFSGAGALSYGHNHPAMRDKLVDYIQSGRITHALDMYTVAKREFLGAFEEIILKPRKMDYRVQFCGPTGTNAVEAAMKLARKVTGREQIVCFTNGFHGMTLGSLSVTGNAFKRAGAGIPLSHTTTMPFCGYVEGEMDSLNYFEQLLSDSSSGIDKPAAVILETVQAEGGVNVASREWMERLNKLCKQHEILLIVDDIQVGCGRTGKFFSFEDWDVDPDMITLSKSLSGYGLPMAIVLLKPEHDEWAPGEHNGTFRGFNPGFVTAVAALETFWKDDKLTSKVLAQAKIVEKRLAQIAERFPKLKAEVRGRGFIQAMEFHADAEFAEKVAHECFNRGLIIETAGSEDQVLKLLIPLIISEENLNRGLDIIEQAVAALAQGSDGSESRNVA